VASGHHQLDRLWGQKWSKKIIWALGKILMAPSISRLWKLQKCLQLLPSQARLILHLLVA
jgi:hypothetical protein